MRRKKNNNKTVDWKLKLKPTFLGIYWVIYVEENATYS